MAANTPRLVLHPLRTVAEFGHPVISKYLRDRGPHLAAMVAYYALLSLVPFLFLTASLLGFAGHVSPNSYLIRELAHILPGQSARDLLNTVHAIQRDAGTLGLLGFLGLVWGTLGFYSSLESALNIVFGVQNRTFLHQKWVTFVLVTLSLLVLFTSLIVTTAATGWYHRHVPHLVDLKLIPYIATLAATSAGTFLFLITVYRVLTNVDLHLRRRLAGRARRHDPLPGAVLGALALPALLRPAARAARVRRPRAAARLALPDDEHPHPRRRDQLVALVAAAAGGAGAGRARVIALEYEMTTPRRSTGRWDRPAARRSATGSAWQVTTATLHPRGSGYDLALIRSSERSLAALAAGDATAFADQYMRIAPQFEVGAGRYAWLGESLFVGRGRLTGANAIEYELYRVL